MSNSIHSCKYVRITEHFSNTISVTKCTVSMPLVRVADKSRECVTVCYRTEATHTGTLSSSSSDEIAMQMQLLKEQVRDKWRVFGFNTMSNLSLPDVSGDTAIQLCCVTNLVGL